MTAVVLLGCAATLAWVARVLAAAGREQVAIYRAQSISPDDVAANGERMRRYLHDIDDARWLVGGGKWSE